MEPTSAEFLPFHLPLIDAEDIQAVCEVLKSGWITTGPKTLRFERNFAQFVGAEHAIAVNSGTAALHLALDAIGLQEGDEVLVPTLTFAATAEAVLYFKARPILVDCQADTWNIDPDKLEMAITPRTRAVIPVHFGGQPCEMVRILEIARDHGLHVIEDAAHALPARYRGKMIGTLSDITCFSFYATKTITTGEGGMATTQNPAYADRMRMMRLHGISKDAWKRYSAEGSWRYEILAPGFKYNLTDLQAALGVTQLAKCYAMWERRSLLVQRYDEALRCLDAFDLPTIRPDIQHAWHLYVIRVNANVLSIHRDWVIEELRQRNIGVSVHFIPLHTHPYYRKVWGYQQGDFPVAENYFDRCLSLPLYPAMSDEDQQRVIDALFSVAFAYRRSTGRAPAGSSPPTKKSALNNHDSPPHDKVELASSSGASLDSNTEHIARSHGRYYRLVKRFVDVAAATSGAAVFSPVMLACVIAIRFDSRGPVLFRQERVGKGGRLFSIFKLRTMTHDPSALDSCITASGDSRITGVGRLLRKFKLDEIPQLINVIKGEMSIVGPRPEVPGYVATYSAEQRRIFDFVPGITSPASLSYINEETLLADKPDKEFFYIRSLLPRKLAIDLMYFEHATLATDFKLVFETLKRIFRSDSKAGKRSIATTHSIHARD